MFSLRCAGDADQTKIFAPDQGPCSRKAASSAADCGAAAGLSSLGVDALSTMKKKPRFRKRRLGWDGAQEGVAAVIMMLTFSTT